jgi:site-specific DNA-methyltransferase (adenine-specific)
VLDKGYVCVLSDCKDAIRDLIAKGQQVDAIVTDPPYELGFMNKGWDKSGIANDVELWKLCLEVLKPGGHLLAFGGSRTYHRMACAIEDAGFEIRDQIMWVYGSGFPKNLNVSKAIDKMAGAEREVIGVLKSSQDIKGNAGFGSEKSKLKERIDINITTPPTYDAKKWDGWGSQLKPAHEPIIVARKPLSEKNIASNVLKHGTGGINIDGCRVGTETRTYQSMKTLGVMHDDNWVSRQFKSTVSGRFPANFIHDGSEEVEASLGSPSRFFYCAKASSAERGQHNNHPTVKPIKLMQYLCRLVTPPNGVILDPFMGSGSTGIAAKLEGFRFIGIEKQQEYMDIAIKRIANDN